MSAVELATTIFFQPQWSCTNSDSLSGPIVLSVSLTGTSTHLFLPYFLATVSLQITVMVTLNFEKKSSEKYTVTVMICMVFPFTSNIHALVD